VILMRKPAGGDACATNYGIHVKDKITHRTGYGRVVTLGIGRIMEHVMNEQNESTPPPPSDEGRFQRN